MDSDKQFDQYDQYDLTNDVGDDMEQMTDPAYDASATGLAGVPIANVAGDTSRSGVAGSSTFDPRISPAHEGLMGSPSYQPGDYDPAYPDAGDGQRGVTDD